MIDADAIGQAMAMVWAWIGSNASALQGLGAIGSFVAIIFAARQVGEASAQRDVSNSFELEERLSGLLSRWSASLGDDKRRDLGSLLGGFEVATASVNHRRFSKVTRYLVTHLVKDGLLLIVDDQESCLAARELMDQPEVCREIRLFLAEQFSHFKGSPDRDKVYAVFFAGHQVMFLWETSLLGAFERWWLTTRMRLRWA